MPPADQCCKNDSAKRYHQSAIQILNSKIDELVKSRIMPFSWIPACAVMTISGLISGKFGTRHTRAGGYPDVAKTFYDFIKIDLPRY